MRRSGRLLPIVVRVVKKAADVWYGAQLVCLGLTGDWTMARLGVGTVFSPARPVHVPKWYRRYKIDSVRAKSIQRARLRSPTRWILRGLFRAVADPERIIWINPQDISHGANNEPTLFCNDVLAGDWDLDSEAFELKRKHRSMVEHLRNGAAWRDTPLFEYYTRLLENRGVFLGMRNIAEIERYYTEHFDEMVNSISEHGFRVSAETDGRIDIPHVHIGRDGEFLFGDNGNHRLVIAREVGVERIPCRVRARHVSWQLLRDRIAAAGPGRAAEVAGPRLASHPDLVDLLGQGAPLSEAQCLEVAADLLLSLHGTSARLELRTLAREAEGGTAVVHIGGWMGASTAQLAMGIRERTGGGEVRLHAVDRWRASRWDVRNAAIRGVRLRPGEDLLPRLRQAFEPYGTPVEWARPDVLASGWRGGPISLYVDGGAAEPALSVRALLACVGSWAPGRTRVAFLDSVVMRRSGFKRGEQTLYKHLPALRACFSPVRSGFPGVFVYNAPVDPEALAAEAREWLSASDRHRSRAMRTLPGAASTLANAVPSFLFRLRAEGRRFAR